jgi:hypothetical protein
VEAGFDLDIGGDVPDWDNTESRESDEDAAWRELVARFEEPATTTEPAPWPERENVAGPRPQDAQDLLGAGEAPPGEAQDAGRDPDEPERTRGDSGPPETRGPEGVLGTTGTRGAHGDGSAPGAPGDGDGDARGTRETRGNGNAQGALDARGTRGVDGVRGFDDEGVRGAFDGEPGTHEPDVIQAAGRDRRTAAHGTRARRIRARKAPPPRPGPEDDEEHFIPPAPPPLPRLDPITKGAWAALFGGPGYLVVATAAGWTVSGIAAFFAVAAFVTGFAILVLRMNEPSGPGPGDPDDGDDGAVV